MKLLIRIFLALFPISSFAQNLSIDSYATVSNKAEEVLTPDSLSRMLTNGYTTDRDKVTSIFRWITENITYNVRPYYNANLYSDKHRYDDEDTGALKPLSERVAIEVLKKRIALCDGYARLFKTLCDYAGIKSEVILGYADGGMSHRRLKFTSNHRWNAVYLDSAWYLLDVTWASGFVTYSSNDFIQNYNNYYFLTPAEDFIRDHYPEDLQWTLLSKPPKLKEFKYSPFQNTAFIKYKIESYKPQSGVIEAVPGDTIQIELETSNAEKRLYLVDTPYVDSAVIAIASLADSSKPKYTVVGNRVFCKYIVKSPDVEWLHVIFNDDVIMRYRVNIRKSDTAAK
ncbi:transglutaminase domain-containing protein [Segetibacter koreensis]|uniref:transglutaminase domain-containing protein n=1 Tax=Segetibacter koreensis TaxID=398037 RepID=UPI000367B921|nr:transglutaminase domain-containing protein [Segetibacter koreensis]